jgi:hypothetical protein
LPTGIYDISESTISEKDTKMTTNEFIYSKTDRCIVLNFKWKPKTDILINDYVTLRFNIKAEYFRLENKHLEYVTELKFKV